MGEKGRQAKWRREDPLPVRERHTGSPTGEEAAVSSHTERVGPFGTGAPVQWRLLPPGVVTPVPVRPVPVNNIVLYKF